MAKPPHAGYLMEIIRRLAKAGDYRFREHAIDERMLERGFDTEDVMKIIDLGSIDGPIVAGKKAGEWKRMEMCGRWHVAMDLPRSRRRHGGSARGETDLRHVEWMDP